MTPLERAARAAQEADGAYRHESGQWMKEGGLVGDGHWEDIARAVLTAIREPSFDMMNAGRDAVLRTRRGGVSGMTIEAQTRNECIREIAAWQAMVDTALTESE